MKKINIEKPIDIYLLALGLMSKGKVTLSREKYSERTLAYLIMYLNILKEQNSAVDLSAPEKVAAAGEMYFVSIVGFCETLIISRCIDEDETLFIDDTKSKDHLIDKHGPSDTLETDDPETIKCHAKGVIMLDDATKVVDGNLKGAFSVKGPGYFKSK